MRLPRTRHKGLCACCATPNRTLYAGGTVSGVRAYCAPCWNTLGVVPNAEHPFEPDNPARVVAHGWRVLEGEVSR